MDQLDDLINEVNSEYKADVDRWMAAIDARLDRMERWGHGKEKQEQGFPVREGSGKTNFHLLAGREEKS